MKLGCTRNRNERREAISSVGSFWQILWRFPRPFSLCLSYSFSKTLSLSAYHALTPTHTCLHAHTRTHSHALTRYLSWVNRERQKKQSMPIDAAKRMRQKRPVGTHLIKPIGSLFYGPVMIFTFISNLEIFSLQGWYQSIRNRGWNIIHVVNHFTSPYLRSQ